MSGVQSQVLLTPGHHTQRAGSVSTSIYSDILSIKTILCSKNYWLHLTRFIDVLPSFCPQACWLPVWHAPVKNHHDCVHITRKVWKHADWIMLDVIFSAHVKCVSLCYRVVSGKDICTVCHKNMYTDEKIVLDDMNINCHASCFKVSYF